MDADLSDARLLLVDDTKLNIDVLVGGLRDHFKLSVALDGENALRSALAKPPDLILLDIMMPDMDGYEVCRRLKADERTRDIPVIFVTALGEVEDETRGFEVGGVDYVQKPVSIPIVRARVETHLTLRRARQKLEKQNQELIEAARLREDVERMARHDLKQPLTSIIGMPQVIKTLGDLTGEQARLLDRITESGYRMLNMVNLSLALYKMEQATYELGAEPFDFIPLTRKVFEDAGTTANLQEIRLDLRLEGREPEDSEEFPVLGEELLSYSMLSNLVKNGVEASPRGASVTVSLQAGDNEGTISIHNMGAVPSEMRERFFEKYATAGKKGGTGLGAYSARLMAETQHGSISMESSDDTGTTVRVVLPLAGWTDSCGPG
jgi:CheY-like chemotaxis protein